MYSSLKTILNSQKCLQIFYVLAGVLLFVLIKYYWWPIDSYNGESALQSSVYGDINPSKNLCFRFNVFFLPSDTSQIFEKDITACYMVVFPRDLRNSISFSNTTKSGNPQPNEDYHYSISLFGKNYSIGRRFCVCYFDERGIKYIDTDENVLKNLCVSFLNDYDNVDLNKWLLSVPVHDL